MKKSKILAFCLGTTGILTASVTIPLVLTSCSTNNINTGFNINDNVEIYYRNGNYNSFRKGVISHINELGITLDGNQFFPYSNIIYILKM